MSSTKSAVVEGVPRSKFACHIDRLILKSGKQQTVIARELGYERPNIISMFKHGSSRVPLDKVPALAASLGVESASLVKMWLAEYEPNLLKVIEANPAPILTVDERRWVEFLRDIFPAGWPKLDARYRGVLADLAAEVAKERADHDRGIEPSGTTRSPCGRPTPEEGIRIVPVAAPDALPPISSRSAGDDAETSGDDAGKACAATPLGAPQPPLLPRNDPDNNSVLAYRYREASLIEIARTAKAHGITQKRLLSLALKNVGVKLHPADMGLRAPARRRTDQV